MASSRPTVFLDSNVVVYAYGPGDDPKGRVARRMLAHGVAFRVSAQVVAEFVSVATRKLPVRLTKRVAADAARRLVGISVLVPLDEDVITTALDAVETHGLDYFDAQIWAAARVGGCGIILSEDTHGAALDGPRYVNPFATDFDVEGFLASIGA